MVHRSPQVLFAIGLLLASSLMAPVAQAFTPPPPEFPDVVAGSGLELPVTKWGPGLGEPTSVLDVLPAGSPAAGDFNRDGWPDLFVPMPQYTDEDLNALRAPSSRLFLNDGSGLTTDRFLDVTDIAGIDVQGFAYSASWGDVDNDGYPDLFVGGYRLARLYHNDGDGRFTDATAAYGLPQDGFVLGGAWGDYDVDGDLDLFLVQFASYTHPGDGLPALRDLPGKANVLLRNDGGVFADVSTDSGVGAPVRRSTSAAFVDASGDGLVDLYVTNYGQPAELWVNLGDGTFEEQAGIRGLADGEDATCQAWEDLDRDGRLDLFVAHQDGVADGVWLAQADGTYASIAGTLGLEATAAGDGWGCAAFDYDNDADIDLLTLHGGLRGERQRNTLMMNVLDEGAFAFVDITPEAGDHDLLGYESLDTLATPLATSGGAVVDWAVLGAPGLIAAPNPAEPVAPDADDGMYGGLASPLGLDVEHLRLFKNLGWVAWVGNGDHFKVQLDGVASNDAGLGAKVTVQAGALTVTRQVGAAMGWGGQSLTDLQAGVFKPDEGGYRGQSRPVNVTVAWPSGQVDVHQGTFGAKRYVRFIEGGGWQNDTLPPRPVLSLLSGTSGETGWYRSDITLRLSAQDRTSGGSEARGARTLRYSLDGTTWTNVASPAAGVNLQFRGDGTHLLWVETVDKAGDVPGWTDNRALTLYPIRIDTTPPTGEFLEPVPGGVYVQGRQVAALPDLAGRSVVVAPLPTGALGLDASAEMLLGSEGRQRVAADAADGGSGVWKVRFDLARPDGVVVPNGTATVRLAPYAWAWPAFSAAAGEYWLNATLYDRAGNPSLLSQKVLLAPSSGDGGLATLGQRPSVPRLP